MLTLTIVTTYTLIGCAAGLAIGLFLHWAACKLTAKIGLDRPDWLC